VRTQGLWLGAILAMLVACEDDECERLCDDRAECGGNTCDPDPSVDSDCDPEAERNWARRDCLFDCHGGEDRGQACAKATSEVSACFVEHSCGRQEEACESEDTRYYDLCVAERPGQTSCRFVCDDLERGCFPSELFGFRGHDCEEGCLDAARDGACIEAVMEFAMCLIEQKDRVGGCPTLNSACLAKAENFAEACDGFAPVPVDPNEEAFCTEAISWLCGCGLFSGGVACSEMTTNQCFIKSWGSEPCRAPLGDLMTCMATLPVCSMQTVGDVCGAESAAFRPCR
jgi:hypothetical protein